MSNKNEKYEQIVGTDYKYGFHTDVENVYDTGKGISEEVVRKISAMKNEDITRKIESLTALMNVSVKSLDFEKAIELRDKIDELKTKRDGKEYKTKRKVEKVREKVYERTRKSSKVK